MARRVGAGARGLAGAGAGHRRKLGLGTFHAHHRVHVRVLHSGHVVGAFLLIGWLRLELLMPQSHVGLLNLCGRTHTHNDQIRHLVSWTALDVFSQFNAL